MAEHRALAASGSPAGVDDGGEIRAASCHHRVPIAAGAGALQQGPGAVVVEREDMAGTGLERQWTDPAEIALAARDHRRFGVADEIRHLRTLVGRVQWQIHMTARRVARYRIADSTDFSTCTAMRDAGGRSSPSSRLAIIALAP